MNLTEQQATLLLNLGIAFGSKAFELLAGYLSGQGYVVPTYEDLQAGADALGAKYGI